MKKLLLTAALSLAAVGATAATTSGTFNVNINLTASCKLSSITDMLFDYTSFQAGAQASTGGGFTLQCTNGLAAPAFAVKLGTAAGAGTASVTTTDSALNLVYTVSAPTAAITPDGTAKSYSLAGSMAANQSGTCASSAAPCTNTSATNKQYTLVVTY